MLMDEKIGLFSTNRLKKSKNKIKKHIFKMQKLIELLKKKKNKISIYGASGKGLLFAQFCKLEL